MCKAFERRIWEVLFAAIPWSIWVARNDVSFNGQSLVWEEVVDRIKLQVAFWTKVSSGCLFFSIFDFLFSLSSVRGLSILFFFFF